MSIRAVIFDLDNTLTHRDLTVQAYAHALVREYQQHLQQVDLEKIISIIRRIDRGGYPLKEQLTHGSIGASVAHALMTELDWQQAPQLDVLSDYWFSQFGHHAVAMQGAEQVLKQLKQQNYKLAVISNGGHETRLSILKGLGFTHYFDEIISSGLVGVSKPKAEIFKLTAAKLGVTAQECIYVGDHPINDVQGALGAGMSAVWMEGFHAEDLEQPIQQRIQNLNQLLQYL